MQIKTTLSNYFSPARPVKIQKPNNVLYQQGHEEELFKLCGVDIQNGTIPREGQLGNINQSYNCIYSGVRNTT